jgi:hypothetical protein
MTVTDNEKAPAADNEKAPADEGRSAVFDQQNSSTSDNAQPATNGGIAPNPFDPAALRLGPEHTFGSVGVKKLLTTIPVRKPNRQHFLRVHSGKAFRLSPAALIEVREDRGEYYLLSREMAEALPNEWVAMTIYTAINRQGVLQLWPIRLPGPDGKLHEAHRSAAEAAERAMSKWLRVEWKGALGAYEISEAADDLPEPVWPAGTLAEFLQIAFRDRYVTSIDHPLIKQLRGKV